ncbi:MAG: hypothetical protein WD423_03650 [Rhodothermales bacterium]
MRNAFSKEPLLDLLSLAVERQVIDEWTVADRYFVFQSGPSRFHVHPSVVGEFLQKLLGTDRNVATTSRLSDAPSNHRKVA